MEIRRIHAVGVGDADTADTGSAEIHRCWRPQPSGADNQHARILERVLSIDAYLRQSDLTRVPEELVSVERLRPGVHRRRRQGKYTDRSRGASRMTPAPKYTHPLYRSAELSNGCAPPPLVT